MVTAVNVRLMLSNKHIYSAEPPASRLQTSTAFQLFIYGIKKFTYRAISRVLCSLNLMARHQNLRVQGVLILFLWRSFS